MFEEIIGNQDIKEALLKSIKNNKLSHSYIFIGIEGIGKKMIAKDFAKMILCQKQNLGCNECKSCLEFNSDNNPDFKIIFPEGNSLKIEQIRELQKKISEKPIISDRKVYIIDDSDKMTIEAQNCLLKTLEEPPEFVTIILIGSNDSNYLSTIKSRCTILNFKPLSSKEIEKYLQEKHDIKMPSNAILQACQGSIGKAVILKDKQEDYKKIENIIYNLSNKDKIDILNMCEILYNSKEEKEEVLNYINVILLNLAKENYKYAKCIKIVEDTKKRLNSNANYDMCIDNMIYHLWEEINN